jgi:hypothetical protein
MNDPFRIFAITLSRKVIKTWFFFKRCSVSNSTKRLLLTTQENESDAESDRIRSDPTIRRNPVGFLVLESTSDPNVGFQWNSDDIQLSEPTKSLPLKFRFISYKISWASHFLTDLTWRYMKFTFPHLVRFFISFLHSPAKCCGCGSRASVCAPTSEHTPNDIHTQKTSFLFFKDTYFRHPNNQLKLP